MARKELLNYNIKLLGYFESQREKFTKAENFFGALCVIQVLLEVDLRYTIAHLLGRNGRFGEKEKYWNYDNKSTYLSNITDYYELLGGDKAIIKNLRKFIAARNKIIHSPFLTFKTENEFNKKIKEVVIDGNEIHLYFYNTLDEIGKDI